MIINHGVQSALSAYAENKTAKSAAKDKQSSAAAVGATQKDEVVLSAQAQTFSQALQKAKNMPEVRQEKVNAIVGAMDAGQYHVDARLIAERMISSRY